MSDYMNVWPAVLGWIPEERPHPVLVALEACLLHEDSASERNDVIIAMFEAAVANRENIAEGDMPQKADFENAIIGLQVKDPREWARLVVEAHHSGWTTDALAQRLMKYCPFSNNFIIFDRETEASGSPRGPLIDFLQSCVTRFGFGDSIVVLQGFDQCTPWVIPVK